MVGMGPFITEPGTPATEVWDRVVGSAPGFDKQKHVAEQVLLTMRMNALARVNLGNVNIAATTALQALDPMGREVALSRGANILMPILTPTKYRENYQLYEGKPCITDTAEECRRCLNARVSMVGKHLLPAARSDPPHYQHPVTRPSDPPGTRRFGSLTPAPRPRGARGLATGTPPSDQAAVPEPRAAPVPGPVKGSDVPRTNVGVFGSMNAGKSTLMNLITRQETSIVDATPGTTADTKVALMELHSVGPAKLFDTAGVDEGGELGEKKRRKALSALRECDIAAVVVDPARVGEDPGSMRWERQVLEEASRHGVAPLVVYNVRRGRMCEADALDAARRAHAHLTRALPPPADVGINNSVAAGVGAAPPAVPYLLLDLADEAQRPRESVVHVLEETARGLRPFVPRSLPERFLSPEAAVFLNIPMDDETPSMRLLRPQALLQEEALRHWATTSAYRMDLAAARSGDEARVAAERARFMRSLEPLLRHEGPRILVTDSQALDVVHPWTLDAHGQPIVEITTFSISMINRQSGGQLGLFARGLGRLQHLATHGGGGRGGGPPRVLIAEACNHNRITDTCNDIGMVQLPEQLERLVGADVQVEHAFGREFPDMGSGLSGYDCVLHCGACMIDHQKVRARLSDLSDAGVPATNYGLFLAWAHHGDFAVRRVLEPWGVPF